ncbi:UbiA family prenyltransferase [Paracoccus salsus]|uniref:UbiA family prenyltransferase n=1 Tax=Paracoccus salsus TaxID=2911061 RepID=UPI001F2124D0|nr:UbiA family prenyltransferase [Paracoccus salsus]MCF3973980.1 UbiA family prenyltransferase [Paracoccus salsus]
MKVWLTLGRVSNLPTVWTNALAGAVLAGNPATGSVVLSALALTAFYVGGMWLNDAFDAEIDAQERANRPIPNREISRAAVFRGGFGLLFLGIVLSFLNGAHAGLAGLCLASVILLYDWLHKRTILSPVIMGGARFFSYLLAALSLGQITGAVLCGALGLMAYTAGLTYAARQEAHDRLDNAWPLLVLITPLLYALWWTGDALMALALWTGLILLVSFALYRLLRRGSGDVPKAVVTLIAGIALYDAVLIAGAGHALLALLGLAGFVLTLALQRIVSGT